MKIKSISNKIIIFLLVTGLLWIPVSFSAAFAKEAVPANTFSPMDIILVIDNSLSMKNNDPQNLTRIVVVNFIRGLNSQSRIGMVVFSGKTELALPLTSLSDQTNRSKATQILNQVDFREHNTDIPAAIERALYELKQNGRKDAQKSIVFMTDGIVETGNQYNDQHKTQWLKEELAGESQKLGIKIFGIAFTEQADFALIQTLGQKTGGGYYRVLKPEDIQGAFDSIQTTMLSLNTVATTVPNHKDPADASKSSTHFWILVIAGVVIVGITIFWVSRKGSGNQLMSETAAKASSVVIPSARMEDVNGISGQEAFEINKTVITIGRRDDSNFNSGIDIPIPAPGVSALHAVIEYRDHNFYLFDRRSLNGTYLNGRNLLEMPVPGEAILKSGDMIAFENQKFRFILRDQVSNSGEIIPAPQSGGTVFSQGIQADAFSNGQNMPYADKPAMRIDKEDDETFFKQGKCANHPSYDADGFCRICNREFCETCLVEHEGILICKECRENLR